MRIVFAGTPEFAAKPLQALIAAGAEVVGVLSQPDRPAGRGRKLTPSPVRQVALDHGLEHATPPNLKTEEHRQVLRAWQPDLMIVIAYGLLLPRDVLDIPAHGCVNVHASLLPRWRGAAPIQRAIEAGDRETGLCLMQMDVGLDTGPVLARVQTPIEDTLTGGQLHDRLCELACAHLPAWVGQLAAGALRAAPQPEQGVTYAHKLAKAESRVGFSDTAESLARKIRAFDPWPVVTVMHGDEPLRLLGGAEVLPAAAPEAAAAGEILAIDADGVSIATGDGVLRVPELQWPGRKRLPARDALNSRQLRPGDMLAASTPNGEDS